MKIHPLLSWKLPLNHPPLPYLDNQKLCRISLTSIVLFFLNPFPLAEKESINSSLWLTSPIPEVEPSPPMPQPPSSFVPTAVGSLLTSVDPSVFPASSSLSLPLPPSSPAKLSSLPSNSIESEGFPAILPGYRQPEEDEENLLATLNSSSSLPFLPDNTTLLPIYRGKELIAPSSEAGTSSSHHSGKEVKAFAWSQGIGSELSPLQTRSSRKKKELLSTQPKESVIPSQDGKALRALKALAHSK
jgi:hypothetical protein